VSLFPSSIGNGKSNSRKVPLSLHAYVWPFVIIWPIFLRYYLSEDLYNKHIGGQEWTFVWCGTIITAQSLVWLCTHWSVNLRSLFTSTAAKNVSEAKLIKVLPVTNAGSADICPLVRDRVSQMDSKCREVLTDIRLGARKTSRSSFRSVDSSTMPKTIHLNP
jgi:hypothetical protein